MSDSRRLCANPEDERLHVPTGNADLPWKDTWYFSIWDSKTRSLIAMHMTVSANRSPDTRVAIGVRNGDRERIVICRETGAHSETRIGNSLGSIEVIKLSWDGNHTLRWRGKSAEFSFDLTVRGMHLAPDFHRLFPGANPSGKQGHSYSHTEQLIGAEGFIEWAGEAARPISGFGWRDRGWGRRKNDVTFATGYDLVAAILPSGDCFAFTAMRNIEHGPQAPLPAYGFYANDQTISPAVSGRYYKDSDAYPALLDLTFAGGQRVRGERVERGLTLGTPFHDAEPQLSGIAVSARDYYAVFKDEQERPFEVFSNAGQALRSDVTRNARFFYDEAAVSAHEQP